MTWIIRFGRQDSNLPSSALKATHTPLTSLDFLAITYFFHSVELFVQFNKATFVQNLSIFSKLGAALPLFFF